MPLHPAYRRPTAKPTVTTVTVAEPSDPLGKRKSDLHFPTPEEGQFVPLPTGPLYVFCERPRCPVCGNSDFQTQRSVKSDDGSITRWSKCRTCGANVRIVWD